MLFCLQQYDVTICYLLGKDMLFIDVLPRLLSLYESQWIALDLQVDQIIFSDTHLSLVYIVGKTKLRQFICEHFKLYVWSISMQIKFNIQKHMFHYNLGKYAYLS